MKLILSLLSVGVLVFSLVLSGCTGGGDSKGSAGIKDVFFLSLESEPSDLHPNRPSEAVSTRVVQQHAYYNSSIIETLCRKDLNTYDNVPNLAESWTVSDDGKIFTYKLRKDVKFHDGSMMTAEDVKFSFDAIFDDEHESYVARSEFQNFDSAEVVDEFTVKFKANSTYYLNETILGELRIMPKKTYSKLNKETNRLAKEVYGSGPYKFEKWNKGKSITLTRFDDWWGFKDPEAKKLYKFKKMVFKPIKESTLRLAMMERGRLDYIDRIRAEDFMKKMNKKPWGETALKVKASNKVPKNMSFIGLNNKNIVLKDSKVRRALAHLVNRPFLNKKFYYGLNDLSTGPFRVGSDYANKSVKPISYDPEAAKSLLNGSGWTDSNKDGVLDKMIEGKLISLEFELLNPTKDSEKIITVIKEDMKKAGVNMKLTTLDWNAFTKALEERKFDAVIMSWGGGGVQPDPTQIWHSKSSAGTGSNFVSYKNPKVDTLIESAIKITDRDKRLSEFHKIHSMIAADAPYIFLFEPKYELYAVTSRVVRPKDTFVYSVGAQTWSLPE
jgi:peptide/nickel transport system substrate-binding protein/microcin C transport system substrate-binding protein